MDTRLFVGPYLSLNRKSSSHGQPRPQDISSSRPLLPPAAFHPWKGGVPTASRCLLAGGRGYPTATSCLLAGVGGYLTAATLLIGEDGP